MRRTGLALLAVLAACSSGAGGAASPSASSATPSSSTPRPSASSTSSAETTTTADPAMLDDLDRAGAMAFLTLFADGLRKRDASLTQAQVDCIPRAVLARLTPQQLFTVVDRGLGALGPDDAGKVAEALRSCQLTDAQVSAAKLG